MPKKLMRLIVFCTLWILNPPLSMATNHHSGHGGGGGAGGGSVGGTCPKISVKNIKPAALTELEPGAEFSALVFGAKTAEDIEITAKEIPVTFTATDREIFLAIKGKLPAELHTTAARINVKINVNNPACDEAIGWLYKIK